VCSKKKIESKPFSKCTTCKVFFMPKWTETLFQWVSYKVINNICEFFNCNYNNNIVNINKKRY
jgi:hypothetical protein